MKQLVDYFPDVTTIIEVFAFLRIIYYCYSRKLVTGYELNVVKVIIKYCEGTKEEYGKIGVSFWLFIMTPITAFISLVMTIFYYHHM